MSTFIGDMSRDQSTKVDGSNDKDYDFMILSRMELVTETETVDEPRSMLEGEVATH